MEESNISNDETNIHNVKTDQIIFLYHNPIQGLPANILYQDINQLEDIDLAEYKHIILQDLLDFYPDTDIISVLSTLFNKMLTGSKLEIQGVDLKQLCVAIANDDVDENLGKSIIYSRKTINNIYDIQNYLLECGFTIDTRKYINIFEYNITAIK